MKKQKLTTTIVYTNSKSDVLITKEVLLITERIKTYALDLSAKGLPKKDDLLSLYLPVITTLFQSLLEKVLKLIGAERIASEIQAIKQNYQKEDQNLKTTIEKLGEELRLLKKHAKELSQNLGHIIRNWRMALFFLGLLSFAETLLNYKIFLPISSNNATALVGATGIAISLFIICHVFKDILNFFSERRIKILVGLGIVGMVTALLYSFARMRLAFISEIDATTTESVSEWNFVILNLTLFLSGVALTLIYKPSKKVFSDYQKHLTIAKQIKVKQKEFDASEKRLSVLSIEKNNRLGELDGIEFMAQSYERILEAEYQKAFALWCSENLIARKQNEGIPKCFSETTPPLTTYFQNNKFQTFKNQ